MKDLLLSNREAKQSPLLLIFNDGTRRVPQEIETLKRRFPSSREISTYDTIHDFPNHTGGLVILIGSSVPQWKPLLREFLSGQNPLWSLAIIPHDSLHETNSLLSIGIDSVINIPHADEVHDFVKELHHHIDALEMSRRDEAARRKRLHESGLKQLIGESPLLQQAKEKVLMVAEMDSPILLSGESGTGKELCARAIHYLGSRSDQPFIPINCGALPEQLIENELFGHSKGAYTGAMETSKGLVADACGGTLFLDEVNSLALSAQVKLLRFLEDGQYKTIGCSKYSYADVRIISATNVNLQREVEEGRFREDLYYRINVLSIVLPPLRLRQGDIPLLANHYLQEFCSRHKKQARLSTKCVGEQSLEIAAEAMVVLCKYHWHGNVRELKNVIEKAVAFTKGRIITPDDLDIIVAEEQPAPQSESLKSCKQFAEKDFLERALQTNSWNISRTARTTGKDRRAIQRLIKKYSITAGV